MKSINEKQKHIYSKANQPNKNQKPKQSKNQTSIEIYQKVRLVISFIAIGNYILVLAILVKDIYKTSPKH